MVGFCSRCICNECEFERSWIQRKCYNKWWWSWSPLESSFQEKKIFTNLGCPFGLFGGYSSYGRTFGFFHVSSVIDEPCKLKARRQLTSPGSSHIGNASKLIWDRSLQFFWRCFDKKCWIRDSWQHLSRSLGQLAHIPIEKVSALEKSVSFLMEDMQHVRLSYFKASLVTLFDRAHEYNSERIKYDSLMTKRHIKNVSLQPKEDLRRGKQVWKRH